MGYAFGDGDVAAERLALLHRVFEPTSRRFLTSAAPPQVDVAVDLGCGPGHTTRLLAEVGRARLTVGIDWSADFIERARREAVPGTEFVVADLAEDDPPVADLVYARYLLSHLEAPESLVERWRSRLRPGGRLLIEENGFIGATDPVLARYEELAGAAIAASGGDLYVGRRLVDLADLSGGSVEQAVLEPPIGDVARLFGLNIRAWGPLAVDLGLASTSAIVDLADELTGLEGRDDRGPARWELVQAVLPAA